MLSWRLTRCFVRRSCEGESQSREEQQASRKAHHGDSCSVCMSYRNHAVVLFSAVSLQCTNCERISIAYGRLCLVCRKMIQGGLPVFVMQRFVCGKAAGPRAWNVLISPDRQARLDTVSGMDAADNNREKRTRKSLRDFKIFELVYACPYAYPSMMRLACFRKDRSHMISSGLHGLLAPLQLRAQ